MRSLSFPWLLAKEWRELLASRAYWLLGLMLGPMVGQGFIAAVNLYAEASGIGGAPAALPQGLTPLDGILVPTFGAYDLALTLLFPFVVIRLVAAEKESGALKLMLQSPAGVGSLLWAKGVIIAIGWLIALIPGLIALVLWKSYGGHLYGPEVSNLLLGYLLRMILGAGVATAAAAIARSASSAAIVTLGFTVGTWALDFVAAGRGGLLQKVAGYTPTAALRVFELGLFRLNTALVTLALGIGGFALAAVWLPTGQRIRTRLLRSAGVLLCLGLAAWGASLPRTSRDVSENHRNSFSPAEEAALRQIRQPLRITIYLAAEDPRLMDLERNIISKLERTLPRVDVDYAAQSRSGLFEGADDHYGEIWYELGGNKTMSRSTTEAIVLETICQLASVPPPPQADESGFAGHPLAARPRWAAMIFHGIWPVTIGLIWWLQHNRRN
ncbi:MAG TPA: ABC transporter permease subunit [Blastocatellia bacterium]|nr:ABC transporter permease subunit [Blastocatellia bacterium]